MMTMVVNAAGLAHEVIPAMKARRSGAIITVASIAGFAPGVAGHTLYPAAKSFAIRFSQSLQAELNGFGVKVTASCPGLTRTEFHQASGTQAQADRAPGFVWQSAETVAQSAIAANERGVLIHVPGLHNRIAVWALQGLPEDWTRALAKRMMAPRRAPPKAS